ncbi:MAG TPA: aldehyde ferredoxin oxidoreductase C-terminal domain-containing protein [Alphaproteobacteria bacterium]|jgi:aldehyde:ferredoxin oxidoreductase|nr:aldehyde ferredoxin oxidoreductase C-terminal domain-containing protein [Alphaproteobacteria bacterium]MDP6270823.1 aldehyde ferredoxin oxidoreductase C-terminal domain-containing protein [Alphaproteobacteria bacterium]MDP7426994.1 aldehyde ferredoxin oxidoreductase C-terminal domain-containing protein [Alphaproteobacteria bacterium]HJM49584.1 aldehyde ferredoxin oxidoreductase C-terminal domain-containing protein [Alphaproteobacteria bacterium]
MRKHLTLDLASREVTSKTVAGEDLARAGRWLIARTLLDEGVATVDPLSPANPLIFSSGPFAGTNFSNANRISVGCKSPLTGGIKEANSGGTFAYAMGQNEISGITLRQAADDWVVIHIQKDGSVSWDDAAPYMGKSNFAAAALLVEKYGDKTSFALCGPVGEYLGLVSGIAFPDPEGAPTRFAARGGVGAVMGSKKIKAVILDNIKMPTFVDRKKLMSHVKDYGSKLEAEAAVQTFADYGTAIVADLTNKLGGLPTNNFSLGQQVDPGEQTFELGGTHIHELNKSRGGETTHACMAGCLVRCSNIFVDENGAELTAPLEYETIGLIGTNCGLTHPDQVARVNQVANDLGIDTIEIGCTIGVLMEAGVGEFGDESFMMKVLEDIRAGNENGRIYAQGTQRVGEHFKVARIPAIKKQGISAYDPRVIEVTGISMMLTAMGADHTVGNQPGFRCADMSTEELTKVSLESQVNCAAADSLGLCIFGRSVTETNSQLLVDTINAAFGTALEASFVPALGVEALKLEDQFNKAAGFTVEDDELPAFFVTEALAPTGKTARHEAAEINAIREAWWN